MVWVIVAYNLALIVGAVAIIPVARRVSSAPALVAGLVVFGLASIGCGASNSLAALIPFRCVQGLGGALILCSSLTLFAGTAREGDSPLVGWAAAAAIGAAIGPAAGGILTQLFTWRAIFFAQAPVAAFAAIAVLAARPPSVPELPAEPATERAELDPADRQRGAGAAVRRADRRPVPGRDRADQRLAGLPDRRGRDRHDDPGGDGDRRAPGPRPLAAPARSPRRRARRGGAGAAQPRVTHKALGIVVVALALCGAGLGLGFPGLTAAALASRGVLAARAAKTIAARDAGLVLGLLLLTPVFVNQLNSAPSDATKTAAGYVLIAPIPFSMKGELATRLAAAVAAAPLSSPPDIAPAFDKVSATATPSQKVTLAALEKQLNDIIERAATHVFKRPFLYAALLALLVLPLLAVRVGLGRLSESSSGTSPRRSPR